MSFTDRLQHAWDAFLNRSPTKNGYYDYGISYGLRPDRPIFHLGNERSIVSSIYTQIAVDVASVSIEHVRLDENGNYVETIDSGLNRCLTLSANIDQTGRDFIEDVVISMFDEGCVAIIPVETTISPEKSGSFIINQLRTGKILEWFPKHVRLLAYNEKTGLKEEIILPKSTVAIVENPFYSIMNEPNSTLQRLIRKLNLLDIVDEQTSSGKLDLIIQLPYVVKTKSREAEAEKRRKQIEMQLSGTKYGIAYTDGTERITQLNRPVENNLLNQVEYLTRMLYSQLGMSETVFNGTADEKTMLNYYNRTVEPILSSITLAMKRTFLTKTAIKQGQSIKYFRDPFNLVQVNELAEIADKFTRNEILSSNEVRAIIGYKPVNTERANALENKNLNADQRNADSGSVNSNEETKREGENQNGSEET